MIPDWLNWVGLIISIVGSIFTIYPPVKKWIERQRETDSQPRVSQLTNQPNKSRRRIPLPAHPRLPKYVGNVISTVAAVVFCIGIVFFTLRAALPTPPIGPAPTLTPASVPTSATTQTSVSTPTGTVVTPATLPLILHCNDCTDRVLVTITSIQIQPDQNRMLWSLAFYNNGQSAADLSFITFYLQKGDQINNPTPSEQTYPATGPVVNGQDFYVQSGETKQTIVTFSFIPDQGILYTLISRLIDLGSASDDVPFDPILFTF